MRIINREPAFKGNYLCILNKYYITDAGKEGVWETVERTNIYHSGAVVIIAVTKDGELILERKNIRI